MKNHKQRHEYLSDLGIVPHHHQDEVDGLVGMVRDARDEIDWSAEAYMVGTEITYINKSTPPRQKQDLLNTKLLAQLAANKVADKLTDSETWYKKYIEVLENVGYAINDFQFVDTSKSSFELKVDQALIELIGAILTQNEIVALKATMDALKSLETDDKKVTFFTQNVTDEKGGRFQISSGKMNANGNVTVSMGAFFTHKHDDRGNFLWISWGDLTVHIFAASQEMELDEEIYSPLRDKIIEKLGDHAYTYIQNIDI